MTTSDPAPLRAPVRLSFTTRLALHWNARLDGARNVPFVSPLAEPSTIDAPTPRIEVLGATAEDSARAEWRALHDRTHADRLGHDAAVSALSRTVEPLAALLQRSVEINGSTPDSEELRRLVRDRAGLQRRIAAHEVSIEEHVKASLAVVEQLYARANLLASVYWHALRRHHRHRAALVAHPRVIAVPSWIDPDEMAPRRRGTDSSTPVDLTERKRRVKN